MRGGFSLLALSEQLQLDVARVDRSFATLQAEIAPDQGEALLAANWLQVEKLTVDLALSEVRPGLFCMVIRAVRRWLYKMRLAGPPPETPPLWRLVPRDEAAVSVRVSLARDGTGGFVATTEEMPPF